MKIHEKAFPDALLAIPLLLCALSLADCSRFVTLSSPSTSSETAGTVDYDADDLDTSTACSTTLSLSASSVTGEGATVSGGTFTIGSAGSYLVKGSSSDGQIVVNTADDGVVRLVLSDATLACSSDAPIRIDAASKVVITVVGSSSVSDSRTSIASTAATDSAIWSAADLSINGPGSLSVASSPASGAVGIRCKDGLKIAGGSITVASTGDGVKGRDYVAISELANDVVLSVTAAGGDGIQAYNDANTSLGFVDIDGGDVTVVSGLDGIQAETAVDISGGSLDVTAGGGSSATLGSESCKGIKGSRISISGGTIDVDSCDDCINSSGSASVSGGTITLAASVTPYPSTSDIESAPQGIKFGEASSMTISGGDITVSSAFEGIGGYNLAISGDDTHLDVTAANDGLSISASEVAGGSESDDGSSLSISGGYTIVRVKTSGGVTAGDGLDSNGDAALSGGTLIVQAASSSPEESIDCNGGFTVSGGVLVAVCNTALSSSGPGGTSGTVVGSASTQCAAIIGLSISASTLFHIQDSATGSALNLTFKPASSAKSIIVSAPALATGTVYTINVGGSLSGGSEDGGLYSGGTYTSGGTSYSLTTSSTSTITSKSY
jgi:hypothetical protein